MVALPRIAKHLQRPAIQPISFKHIRSSSIFPTALLNDMFGMVNGGGRKMPRGRAGPSPSASAAKPTCGNLSRALALWVILTRRPLYRAAPGLTCARCGQLLGGLGAKLIVVESGAAFLRCELPLSVTLVPSQPRLLRCACRTPMRRVLRPLATPSNNRATTHLPYRHKESPYKLNQQCIGRNHRHHHARDGPYGPTVDCCTCAATDENLRFNPRIGVSKQ